jgi:hypothetical protein
MTAEIALLLDKAQQNLDAARLLCDSGYLAIAASRSYYSMLALSGLHLRTHVHMMELRGNELRMVPTQGQRELSQAWRPVRARSSGIC